MHAMRVFYSAGPLSKRDIVSPIAGGSFVIDTCAWVDPGSQAKHHRTPAARKRQGVQSDPHLDDLVAYHVRPYH